MTEDQNRYNEYRNLDTYSRSHIGEGRGERYEKKMFSEHTHGRAVWELEKIILSQIINKERRGCYLDFACGTGRVAGHMESAFAEAFGIDISADMIKVAQSKLQTTKLFVKDIIKDDMNYFINKFDVITSFRFFLNAEQDLKIAALKNLRQLTNNDGIIIFNIHQHANSPEYLTKKLRNFFNNKSAGTGNWMSKRDIIELLNISGLKTVNIYSYAFLPGFFLKLFKFKMWFNLEKFFVSKRHHWGSHLIIVCKKMHI